MPRPKPTPSSPRATARSAAAAKQSSRSAAKTAKASKASKYVEDTPKPGKRGREFKPGNPGKPKGAKDAVPRSAKASVRAIIEEVVNTQGATVRKAIVDGLKAGPRHADRYVKLCVEHTDGRPTTSLHISGMMNEEVIAARARVIAGKMDALLNAITKRLTDAPDPA